MTIRFIIDRFENDDAVLITEDGFKISWPKNRLPAEVAEGHVLEFLIGRDLKEEAGRRQLAKDILNEILETDDEISS
jgi:hypothetical protein